MTDRAGIFQCRPDQRADFIPEVGARTPITADLKPARGLAINTAYATGHAHFFDVPGADRIPNALGGS